MNELEQKLSSGNVFLQSQAITILQDKVIEKIKAEASDNKIPELKKLWELANLGDFSEARIAVETIVKLVQDGFLPPTETLKNFLADISSAKNPLATLQGITQLFLLLCEVDEEDETCLRSPFTGPPKGPVHPFILVANKRPDITGAILTEVEYLLQHPDPRVQKSSINLIRPMILHTFCLTEKTPPITFSLIEQILASYYKTRNENIIDILCKISILIKPSSKDHLERKLSLITSLASIALNDDNEPLQLALLPCLILSLPLALKYGYNIRKLEHLINNIIPHLKRGCDVTLSALAEVLPQVSGSTQVYLLRIAASLLSSKDGNPLVGGRLLPSLLQILSAPCTAVPGLMAAATTLVYMVQTMPSQISSNLSLSGNPYWEGMKYMYVNLSSYIPAINFCNQIIRDPDVTSNWLNKLAETTDLISGFHYTIITSVFLYQGSTPAAVQDASKVLEREVVKRKSLAIEFFPMVLYRLGQEQDPTTRLTLLYLLPSLAVNKLCIALVLKTLLALWSSPALRPLIMKLMFELWTVEPRVYSYLSQLINDKTVDTLDIQIARAFVVTSICKLKPSQHGEELLPLLSKFLNECREETGTAQTVLALDGIYNLCTEAIIDLRTTWRVIAPKLVRDKRSEVIVKLCNLLSLAPKFESKNTSAEYEAFINNALSILWNWATNHPDMSIVEAAYNSLSKFNIPSHRLKMLPQYARQGLKLPESMATNPFEAAKKPEDVLQYVPGQAWVNLVSKCPANHVKFIQTLVKSLVVKEVAGLPKGIYLTALQDAKKKGFKGSGGKPEPPTYSFLSDNSTLKAIVHFLNDFSKVMMDTESQNSQDKLLQTSHILLSSLGQSLNRPLPALDWIFLNEVLSTAIHFGIGPLEINWEIKIQEEIYKITARQCSKSPSAAALMTKYLNIAIDSGVSEENQIVLCSLLDCIGCGIAPTTLQPFLAHVLETGLNNTSHLKSLLDTIRPHITVEYIHDTNRNVICNNIEALNEKIDPMDEKLYFSYKACVADLPLKHIERLTSPSLWWEITDDRLYRAAGLRCHVASNDPEELSLPWLNDLVDSAASLPGDRAHLLLVMADTLVNRSSVKESTTWFLQLLGRLKDHLKKELEDNIVAAHEQQQRVTFYIDLLIIGLLIWSGLWATSTLEKLSSTPILMDSLLSSALISLESRNVWKETVPQFLNWLVLTNGTVIPYTKSRYHLKEIILLLAIICPDLGQKMWNKIVQIMI